MTLSAALRAELFRLLRRRMTLILALLLVALTGFVYVAFVLAIEGSNAADVDPAQIADLERLLEVTSVAPFGDDVVWQLVSIMAIILMSATIGSEFSWRTVITNAVWTGSRARLVLAKLLVTSALTAVAVAVGFAVCLLASIVIGVARGTLDSGQITAGLLGDIAAAGGRTWLAVIVYVLLAATVTMLARNMAVGITVGLAVLFLEGLVVPIVDLLGDSFGWLKDLLMNWNVQGLLAANGEVPGAATVPDPGLPGAWQSAVVLVVYCAAYVAATLWVFHRRDITE